MKKSGGVPFSAIVAEYKSLASKKIEQHIQFTVSQPSLTKAIEVAALGIDENNKRHFHQRRVDKNALENFAKLLLKKEAQIQSSTSFHVLKSLIDSVSCEGISDLTKHDVAIRIGAYLKLPQEYIYLQGGIKIGASHILDVIEDKTFIPVSDLPKELLIYNLTASEFEDLFFTFKDDLAFVNIDK